MEFNKWLKRKYPTHFIELKKGFQDHELERLKLYRYKVGRLTKDDGENKIGDLVLYHLGKEYGEDHNGLYSYETGWTGQFEYTYTYQKPASHWCSKTYELKCEEIKPYKNE